MPWIDFSAKKTEEQWSEVLDYFTFDNIPRWFDLMQWALITGGLLYLAIRYHGWPLYAVAGISWVLLTFYVVRACSTVIITGSFFTTSKRVRDNATVIVSVLFSMGLYWTVYSATQAIARHGTTGEAAATQAQAAVAAAAKSAPKPSGGYSLDLSISLFQVGCLFLFAVALRILYLALLRERPPRPPTSASPP